MEEVEQYVASRHIRKIYPTPNTFKRLQALFQTYPVEGPLIFDLYLAATMLENGVTKIYTYNTADFVRISEIEVLEPDAIIAAESEDAQESEQQDSATE